MKDQRLVVVFGATGQQGGSVAHALHADGWKVRAVVRKLQSSAARALSESGIATVAGDFDDAASLRSAITGAYGVFSVQPSSGQGPAYGLSDDDEIRYGKTVIDIAQECGVQHVVYSSACAARASHVGVGHFDSKADIEAHLQQSGLPFTIVRPTTFMEILLSPGFGLDRGRFNFFMRPQQAMQFIAVCDIGRIVAQIFGDRSRYRDRTIEIAGDSLTGVELAEHFSKAAGHPIVYERLSEATLQAAPMLAKLAQLVDDGPLAGNADLAALAAEFPGLLSVNEWLAGDGREPFLSALQKSDGLNLR